MGILGSDWRDSDFWDLPLRPDVVAYSSDVDMDHFYFGNGANPEFLGCRCFGKALSELHGRQGSLSTRRLEALMWPVATCPTRCEVFSFHFAQRSAQSLLSSAHRQLSRTA